MRLSIPLLTSIAAIAFAAPIQSTENTESAAAPIETPESVTEQSYDIPSEAIVGSFEFQEGQGYTIGEDDAGNHILIIFSEEADVPTVSIVGEDNDLAKRWGWKKWRFGSPMIKREDSEDVDIEQRWGWKKWRFGSPMIKREDSEDVDIEQRWGWKKWRFGSPMIKREDSEDVDIEQRWGWKKWRFGSPMI